MPNKDRGNKAGKGNAKKPKQVKEAGNRPHEVRDREAVQTHPR
jgi:hypothetical protein